MSIAAIRVKAHVRILVKAIVRIGVPVRAPVLVQEIVTGPAINHAMLPTPELITEVAEMAAEMAAAVVRIAAAGVKTLAKVAVKVRARAVAVRHAREAAKVDVQQPVQVPAVLLVSALVTQAVIHRAILLVWGVAAHAWEAVPAAVCTLVLTHVLPHA